MNAAEGLGNLHWNSDGAAQQGVERIHPKNLALEYKTEVAGDGFRDGFEIEFATEFTLHRGDRLCRNAAGDDQVEVTEVGVDVEREAVRGNEAGDVDADGGKLGFGFSPDAGEAGDTLGRDSEVRAGADENFFETTDEFDHAEGLAKGRRVPNIFGSVKASLRLAGADEDVRRSTSVSTKIEDWVADDLTRAMEGNVSAAIAFEKFDATLGKEFLRRDYVRGFGVAAKRDDWCVLEQEQDIADFSFFTKDDELLLQIETGDVVNGAELDKRNQLLFATDLHGFTSIKAKSFHHGGAKGNAQVLRAKNALRMTGFVGLSVFMRVNPWP